MEHDIVPKPRTFMHSMEKIMLHFGCQISNEAFAVLWRGVDVSVNFDRTPSSMPPKSKVSSDSDPLFNFFKDDPDDKWVRATDFTPSSCIGQSTGLCLELPYRLELPNFKENFGYYKESDGRWLTEQYQKYPTTRNKPRSSAITLDGSLVYVHRTQVTPCKVYFYGPEVNVSNRVLRHYRDYIDNFLRISFIDEDLDKIHSIAVAPRSSSANEHRRTGIYTRILSTLQNGVVIGDKKFEFLAFSSSQLRENSAWMFASTDGVTAAHIREWMGNFRQIRNVAKYAARLGQSFGSSTETLSVREDEFEVIPDVQVKTGGTEYVFSDGIGKISVEFARRVAQKCGIKDRPPSAFQIRFGGYKGVVAVDPTSTKKLSMRRIFEKKQREAVDQLNAILTDPLRAQEALELMSPGENTNILKEMLLCGYKPDAEPFLSMMLQTFRASKLLELRTKTRIFVQNGRSMMGCLDETRTLDYGQVFVQFSKAASPQRYFIEGEVVVAKNPCLHPGDVRVLRAVNVPALYHMVDCVVFPQKGMRPHTNECSGSDLDGDIYFVCWDPELIPPRQISPMDYTPEPSIQLDHDVTIEEVQEYFTNYIVNDSLGIIANAHTAFADKEPGKAMSDPCLELAKNSLLRLTFQKLKPTYESRNGIGKLFREVRDIAPDTSPIKSFTGEVARRSYDHDMEVDGFEDHIEDAFYYKSNFDYKLGNLMDYYGIRTEAEILSGGILKMSKSFTKEKRCRSNWYGTSAWYHATYHPNYWGSYNEGLNRQHFLSFAWCVYDKLIEIKRDKTSLRNALSLSSLQHSLSHGLLLH
ncbi:hypothetical protein Patl1_15572 [Pistacia atlantica]|uniref:Uncharacterized protein n=1 Tax=Pistacia atlantica TaxID=434234 RepID=A0ACC1B633_9ROSI|nr:hypothetical protein Patl1_15572 [Pistacia atlantica]